MAGPTARARAVRSLPGLAALALALPLAACGDDGGPAGATDAAVEPDGATPGCTATGTWTPAPPLPLGPTQETAAVGLGGQIYVLGGFNGSLGVIDAVQIFDPVACAWSAGPALPRAVHHANAAVVGDTIYVLGAMTGLDFQAIGEVWSWRPATETAWTTHTPMPAGTARGSATVGVLAGIVYLAGGLRGGTAVAEVSAYDPAADTWATALPALPAARDHGCGGAIAGTLYVAGGRRASIGSTAATVYAYQPGGAWAERAPMPTGRGGTACGVIADRLIVAGGEGNPDAESGVFPQVEAYAPATDTWTVLAPMPTPRHGLGAAVAGDRLYLPGGATRESFGAVATHDILTP